MNKTVSIKNISRKKAAAAILLAAAVFVLAVFFIRLTEKEDYDYIDLPIILSNESDIVAVIRDALVLREDQINVTFSAKGRFYR